MTRIAVWLGMGVAMLAAGQGWAQTPLPTDRVPRDQSATAGYDYTAWGMKNGQIEDGFLDKVLKGAQADGSMPSGLNELQVVNGKVAMPAPPPVTPNGIPGAMPRGTGRGSAEGLVIGPDGLIHRGAGSAADAALLGLGPDQAPTQAAAVQPPLARPATAAADPSARRITAALNALQAAGYLNIKDLEARGDGVHATASRNGARASVIVDPKSGAIRTGS